jgi:hypothetical protein
VRLVGDSARKALESGLDWKILALFQRGIYCQDQAGRLVFLGPLSMEPGPLNALCEMPEGFNWREEGFHPDAPVRCEGQTLWVDNRFGFSFADAGRWRGSHSAGKWDWPVAAERLPLLSSEADRRPMPDGFGSLIPAFSSLEREPSGAPNPLIRAAWPGIRSLFLWLKGEFSAPSRGSAFALQEKEIQGLIGLGPGLTPSGDDLLGGSLIALHALGRKDLAGKLGDAVMAQAPFRTHRVSLAHLGCAADGEGAAALHDAIAALGVRDDHRLIQSLDRIDAVGSTSGWDSVVGVFLVVKAFLDAGPALGCAHGH